MIARSSDNQKRRIDPHVVPLAEWCRVTGYPVSFARAACKKKLIAAKPDAEHGYLVDADATMARWRIRMGIGQQ